MKITAIETLRLPERPNLLLAQFHTDEGLVGLGETSRGAQAVEAQLHELVAPYLLGKDPLEIQKHSKHLMGSYLGFASSSTEIRAASVVDVALWDILGQALNQPIHTLLGGMTRDRIRAYNTCAGYHYNTRSVTRRLLRAGEPAPKSEGCYDDQIAFVHRADELAQSLLEEGYTAMKIWPFDLYAEDNGGGFIPARDLDIALEPWRKIRKAVGDVLANQAADIVMLDIGWCGGLTEARKIAALAEAWQRPVAPHDCNGPVVWVASIHFMAHIPNALIMEVVRAYFSTWYKDILTELPLVKDGYVHPLNGPGLGTRLLPDLAKSQRAIVRRSGA